MTAATAPSPSPAPSSAPPPLAHTPPTRQSSNDAIHASTDASATRRHDPSTSASPAIVNAAAAVDFASTNLGTLAKPIDLASPPGSPTIAPATAAAVASQSTRPPSQSSVSLPRATNAAQPSSATAPASVTPFANVNATPTRVLPPTPLGNAPDRAAATPSATPSASASKQIHLPSPYKAPRLAQAGASESFATAYPTQETRQKYASPSKPLLSATGNGAATLSHKRSWQSPLSVDLANKKLRPTPAPSSARSTSTSAASAASAATSPASSNPALSSSASAITTARPLSTLPVTARATNTASGITVTNIPKPGSPLSRQAGVGPLNLVPAVPGTQLPASTRDEYLSLLHKSELIDLVKQLERQLHDLIVAPIGSSALYRQARIYPNHIHTQIDRLKARQRIESSRPTSTSDLSLKDVYSLLNSGTSTSSAAASIYARTRAPQPRSATSTPTAVAQSTPSDAAQNASLTNLINSINAMVRQQAQPARGPNGAPLPPALSGASASALRTGVSAPAKARQPSIAPPSLPAAALRSIVGDGPMPSNAALAAAIAAHFGGSLPGSAAATTRATPSPTPASTPARRIGASESRGAIARTQTTSNDRNPPVTTASPTPAPGKDISDKIAAILGSSSSAHTTMLGPQGLPLAPAAAAPASASTPAALPIGNIAAMLSSLAGQDKESNLSASTNNAQSTSGMPAAEGQGGALASLLQQLEEAKKRLSPQAGPSQTAATPASSSSSAAAALSDPIAILTGASANPVFTPTYPAGTATSLSPGMASHRDASWSPEPEPVIVQGPLGTSTLPSYEDMIVEGLRIMGEAPPRTLFNWMQVTYPLTKKFRPSAHQALQKAFKRGRLLKTGSMYRINSSWSSPGESRKPTRRPQVGRDHPMVTPGLNGEVLAVSPLKDSQAYRNVGDSGLRPTGKGARAGPRPYGQPGAAPLANPASSIFQNGSAASIILEYQKRTAKKLDADSVKQLYQLIRSGPSDGPAEEMLAYLLTQTGYHDAAATATAAAAAQSAAATMPQYVRPHASMSAVAASPVAPGRMGVAGGTNATQRRLPVAKGPTSLPLPTTSEPTMMQQLASMLNDLSSPINPVLANSLLGQLSSNAAAAAAARAANMPAMGASGTLPAAPPRATVPTSSAATSASSQLASALSSLAGTASQQDLDSAVSQTLAAALQQIESAPNTASKPAVADEAAAPQPAETEGQAAASVAGEGDEARELEEGIDLAEYEDAIRALTSAFGGADEGDSEESDNEADERAIAAAEAEPDSLPEAGVEGHADEPMAAEGGSAKASSTAADPPAKGPEGMANSAGEPAEEEDEEEDEEGDAEEMDLSAVLQQLTASLQAHQESEAEAQGGDVGQGQDEGSAAAAGAESDAGVGDLPDRSTQPEAMEVDRDSASAREQVDEDGAPDGAQAVRDAAEEQVEGGDSDDRDAASLQAQLEALVASLAANAGNADDDDEEDEDEEELDEQGQ
ncbi:hypothetical protein PaG_00001 [Moesziomyces aphidis]|uniref:Histone H1 n=1 Tax=Moesziomyces aphidis TaxID=84754 RepID=W3VUR9_MOEAP|nr:hypothetical protein PaG_00001 [Moesziomyces aphidis]